MFSFIVFIILILSKKEHLIKKTNTNKPEWIKYDITRWYPTPGKMCLNKFHFDKNIK